ncbi:hypothetical protein FRC04_009569 [Tulasnella sp. 424]|nr:hypothetical protein FRC04_009569 [Tulasnella sp. 424]KAG8974256.1 hypothetical protein FRC05_007680 [Tulasnella sp. 425]
MGPNSLKRKRNPEDEALQRLMIKRERIYLAQQGDSQHPPFDSPWSMMNPGVLAPHMAFSPPPIHMGFNPPPMSLPVHPTMAPMVIDPSFFPFSVPSSFGSSSHPEHPHSKYRLGTPGDPSGHHGPADYSTFPPDVGFEWGFNSDDEQQPAPVKSKKKKNRKNKKSKKAKKEETAPAEVPPTQCSSDMEASEPEEGQIVTPEPSVSTPSSGSSPHSTDASYSASVLSWSIDDSRDRHSPPAAVEPEEMMEMAQARLKMCVAELKDLMGKLDEAKTKEEKLKLLQLVKAKDGELTTAQEAVKVAEAEAEAVKLMNHAVSEESAPTFNDSKLRNPYQLRNPGGFRQMSWSNSSLPSHLRFLRISSPACLVIELDDEDDEEWEME